MKKVLHNIIQNRVFQHALFWSVSWLIFANTFKVSANLQKIDLIYSGLFHVSLIESVYLNLLVLIPKLLNKKKYIIYFWGTLAVIMVGIQLNIFTFNYLTDKILKGYYFISYYNHFDLLKFFVVYLSTTTLLKLSKAWFKMQEMSNKLLQIKQEHVKSELKALKSQVNPHFLFNSLNLLYSLAIKNSTYTPEAIIKLSDILRYVTYDIKKEKIKLKNEIKLIQNYLDLQKLRIDIDAQINFKYQSNNPNLELPPMLLLPLVENSFKHGIMGRTNNTFLSIELSNEEKFFKFQIVNNKPDKIENGIYDEEGIGLENIRKRLSLIYPDNHEFEVVDAKENFKVTLSIYETDKLPGS